MANCAYLLNTPDRITDMSLREGEWFGVAAKAWRVPVTWICLFRPSDLGPCTIDYQIGKTIDGEKTSVLAKSLISNPSTSVAAARENLESSRALFEALAGDPMIGSEYWAAAMSALEMLPLGFITIDPTEVLVMDDIHKGARALAGALGSDAAAIKCLKEISSFTDGYVPLRREDFLGRPYKDPSEHYNNSAALDGGILEPSYFIHSSRSAEAKSRWLAKLASIDYS
jgi:hypothetical protein